MPTSLKRVVTVVIGLSEQFCDVDKSIKRRLMGRKGERRGRERREEQNEGRKERKGKERSRERKEKGEARKGQKKRRKGERREKERRNQNIVASNQNRNFTWKIRKFAKSLPKKNKYFCNQVPIYC